jgi:hypothetical protein
MRASVATLSCLVQRYCRTATMIRSDPIPDKTAIQKRGNFLVPRSPIPLVLEVDERFISELKHVTRQVPARTTKNYRPGERECAPVRINACRQITFLAYEICEFRRLNRGTEAYR